MPRLFTYTIPVDDGAAPNPFHNLCTLVICKPAIRRVAGVGDWVVGLGSKDAPSGDLSKRVVYAMKVTEVVSLKEYDRGSTVRWPNKVPRIKSAHLPDRLGDCIYDFSADPPLQRLGVHKAGNQPVDIRGNNALISDHFFYFGAKALPLPEELHAICHQTQGHRSTANQPYFEKFVAWITSLRLEHGQLYGWPDFIVNWNGVAPCSCEIRQRDDEQDRETQGQC